MIEDQLRKFCRDRMESGVSLREIARQTGIPAGNLSRVLSGDREPSAAQIRALVEYFGVRLTEPRKRPKQK